MKKSSVSILLPLFLVSVIAHGASVETVVARTESKVVKIGTVFDSHKEGVCSGVMVNKYGDVLTCAHCFGHGRVSKVFIKMDGGNVYDGTIIQVDKDRDLAMVALFSVHDDFPYIRLGSEPQKGQQVVLFGSPLEQQGTISVGWIENFFPSFDGIPHRILIQSAATNPGNSGGPLVDLDGRLVGIGEGEIMMNPFVPALGMGFAVDLAEIKAFLGN